MEKLNNHPELKQLTLSILGTALGVGPYERQPGDRERGDEGTRQEYLIS